MYIYFDRNGTIQEVINDESIRKGSNDYNKIYCYLEGNPDIDDIWYLQKNPDGTLTNEVSFVDNIVTKAIPYDSHRDMKYFQDFEEYQFYVFTLSSSYLLQSGLVVATIRVEEDNTMWALGELTFNVQANVINSDNEITQSQYDYLLITISSYYSKTEIDNKLSLKADKSDTYTKAQVDNRLSLKADKSDTYTKTEVDGKLDLKADKSNTYTKQEVNEEAMRIYTYIDQVDTSLNTRTSHLEDRTLDLENDVENLKSVQNVVDIVPTYSALQSYDTSDLGTNDKIQVIADETHEGASTIYNWDGTQWQYVGAFGTNSYTKDETYTKQETLEQIDIHKLINKTYSELATLKANNGLVAGQMYRITDYVTKTNGKCNGHNDDVRSVEYPFDVIVTAISNNEFSENARAIHHTGANYFSQSKLEAWRLWYSFDNDIYRFEWADTRNGKGVIYRMIDEFQNDLPYDFKNIQFKRYKITGVTDQRQSSLIGKYLGFYENYNVTSDSNDYVWRYTFSKRADNSDLSLFEIDSATFNQNSYVKQVVIGEYITDNPTYRCKQALNNIVMEVEALIVDVSMGKGSHHNTWIGNEDIDYCYFASMFRQNILYGEINHTRADECFEKNVIGDGALTTYASCWNKFSHHFSRNIGINMQSNDFEGQVDETKFPLHFTRNHISNMLDEVNASSHTTFNRCEFGYVVTATFGGTGTWDGVKSIMLWNTTININNFFGATLGRLEYVTISQGTNGYNILNLTTGALNGSSGKPLIINLSDISNLLATSYEKNITFAWHNLLNAKCLVYSVKVYDKTNNLVYDTNYAGIINTANNNVTWEEVGDIGQLKALINTKADTSYVDGKLEEVGQTFEIVGNEVLKKVNAEYICKGANITQTTYSNTNPSKSTKVVLSKVGGMSYKSENLYDYSSVTDDKFWSYSLNTTSVGDLSGNSASDFISVLPNTQYTITTYISNAGVALVKYWKNTTTESETIGLRAGTYITTDGSKQSYTITTPSDCKYITINCDTTNKQNVMIVKGSTTPTTYKPYGILDSAITQIRSKNGSTSVDSLSIPTNVFDLTGYGWGINDNCYNYIDFENKKFVQKVGKLVLNGTEDGWNNYATWQYNSLRNLVGTNYKTPISDSTIAQIVSNYNVVARGQITILSNIPAVAISADTNGSINVQVGASNVTDLKTYLGTNNLVIYYELATPVETDISEYLTTDTIDVEPLGTLEFLNTYNQAVPNEIAYLFNAVTLNNIVDSNGNTNVIATKQELNEKSKVVANPTLAGTEADLTGLEVDGTKYKVSSGGGSEVHLYRHIVCLENPIRGSILIENANSQPFTFSTLHDFLVNGGHTGYKKTYPFTGLVDSTVSSTRQYSVGLYTVSGASTIWSLTTKSGDTIDITNIKEDMVTQIF